MLERRVKALKLFYNSELPKWSIDLSKLKLDEIIYFAVPKAKENSKTWEEVPDEIKRTFEKLGIPEAERKFLAGAGSQYESLTVYHNLKEEWEKKGVIFEDMDSAVKKYPELVMEYFMKGCVPIGLHKFSALHCAVWSGGTFIYIPKNVHVTVPLQAYFRMNAKNMGQFEHTLIIADEGAEIHYIEGCFTKGNIITANPEYKIIEEIEEGDKVLTADGSYKKVKEIFKMLYTGTISKLSLWGNSTSKIEVTDEHPFLYVDKKCKNEKNKEWKIRWNIPKYFKKGDYLAVPINKTIISKDFHETEIKTWNNKLKTFNLIKKKIPSTNDFFKLAGYYLAEGSISSGYYLNFSFSNKEKNLIEDVKILLKKVFGIEKALEMPYNKNNGISLVVCSVELCRIFEIFGKKANLKNIPSWMMLEDMEKQKYLIEGCYKGDGNYYNKISKSSGNLKEAFRINSVSKKLIMQCRDILFRIGIVSFVNARNRDKENRRTIYTLGISGDQMPKFGKITGISVSPKLNNRKRAGMFGINGKFAFYPIKDIERRNVENEVVYNFSVENNETYCVNGVAVHNCSAPVHSENSLHAGCVEIFVKKNARVRYSSVENWSKNTYNLNTKRAVVEENGVIEWVSGNLGSGVTMLYPCSILKGENSKSSHISIVFAGRGQNQDVGAKVIHLARNTSSVIKSKSISKDNGVATYRGLVKIGSNCRNSKSHVECDALMIGNNAKSNTIPYIETKEKDVEIGHEATAGKIDREKLFYLMARGLSEEEALQLIVNGFIEPITKELPLEYALELNRLIEMEMENKIG